MTSASTVTRADLPPFWVWSQPAPDNKSGIVHLYLRERLTSRPLGKLVQDLESLTGISYVDQHPQFLTVYWHSDPRDSMVSGTGELIEEAARVLNIQWPCNYGVICSEVERDAMAKVIGGAIWS